MSPGPLLPEQQADVAILGAGPVGQLLALLLGRRGWRVEVLERRDSVFSLPRAVHLDHEAARILQGVGLMDELARHTEAMDAYEWRNAEGKTLLTVQGGPGISGWPESLMFCQVDLERALASRLSRTGACRVNWGWEVDGLYETPDGYEVRGTRADGSRAAVEAKWVIACDGANSTARALLGAEVEDFGFSFGWVVADIVPHAPRRWSPLNVQVCDPARPTTAVSGGPGRRRFEFLCLPEEDLEEMARPTVIWGLLADWGISPDIAELERHAGYTFQSRLAPRWQLGANGRVLLAGDAAHQMPPFAGQGLCAGLRDAANLAWKLDLVLSGKAGESLIGTYCTERLPVARAEVQLSVALGQIICVLGHAEAAERDAVMVPAAAASGPMTVPPPPPLGPGAVRSSDPQAGALCPQGVVGYRGRQGLFDDVMGRGKWALLTSSSDLLDGLSEDLLAWFSAVGGIAAHVGPAGVVDDVEATYARWFAQLGADVVLQRPDFRAFGAATGASGAAKLMADACRAVSA